MASKSSKRSRNSESPTRPDMIGVQVRQKKQACNLKSIMSLGLAAQDPDERTSSPGFGEFLTVCRCCKKKIGGGTVYMFGNFYAFCKPECREIVGNKLYEQHLFESGLDDKRIEDGKKKPM